jgi:two-component system, sensor histidine kinase and response regulator
MININVAASQPTDKFRAPESLYRQLYEAMMDAAVLTDLDGHILEFNETYSRMLGYAPEELRRLTYLNVTPEKWHANDIDIMKTQVLERGYSDIFEKEYRRKDGGIFPVETKLTLLRDEAGKPSGCWGIIKDISDRKKVNHELRNSNAKYRGLFDSVRDGFVKTDMEGHLIESNQIFQNMLGYTAEELNHLTYQEITPQKWHDMEARIVSNEVLKQDYSEIYEKEYQRKDGTIFPIELRMALIRDEDGKPSGMWAMVRDITERRMAEMALVAGETKYFTLHESMMDAFSSMDMEGNIIEFNDVFQNMLGYSTAELHRLTHRDLTPEKWQDLDERIIKEQILSRGYSDVYEKEYGRKDGSLIPVELRFVLIKTDAGKPAGMWAMIRDITERKRTEEELNLRNLLLTTQQEAAIDGILIIGEAGDILSFNQRFVDLWHIPSEALATKSDSMALGSVLDKLVDPQLFLNKVQYLYQNHHEISRDELALKDGRTFDRYSGPMIAKDGKYYGRVWFFRDITENKLAEEALRKSEEKYRTVIENMQDVFYRTDLEGNLTMLSPSGPRFLGYDSIDKLLGVNVARDLYAKPEDREGFLRELQTKGFVRDFEVALKKMDGSLFYASANSQFYYSSNGELKGVEGILRDIHERRKAQEALEASEERYRLLIENAGEAIFVIQDYKISYSNDKLGKILGYSQQEVIDNAFVNYIHPDDKDLVIQRLQARTNGEKAGKPVPVRVLASDGNYKWLQVDAVKIVWDGHPATLNFATDVTDQIIAQNNLKASEIKFRTIFEHSTDALVLGIDKIIDCNQKTCELLGCSREDIIGHSPVEFAPAVQPDNRNSEEGIADYLKAAFAGSSQFFYWQFKKKNGNLIDTEVSLKVLTVNNEQMLIGVIRDISQRKRAEETQRKIVPAAG